jgi:Kef-type K+ transport system membrane component KefB
MSAAGHGAPVDVLRKGAIVACLVGGMVLLHRFAVPSESFDPRALLAVGFVVLAAYAIGELAEAARLPHLTGYLVTGLLLGDSAAEILREGRLGLTLPAPFDHGLLGERVLSQLGLFDTLALALICLSAGGALSIERLRAGGVRIAALLAAQALFILPAFAALALMMSGSVPGLSIPALGSLSLTAVLAIGAVLASIALETSPAATIAIVKGAGADGPYTRLVVPVVVLKDVLVVASFAAASSFVSAQLGLAAGRGLAGSLVDIGLAIAIGLAFAGAMHAYVKLVGAELLLFLIATVFFAAFTADRLHLPLALVYLASGFALANFSDASAAVVREVERLSAPVYVVFFTLSGAKLHIDLILRMAPLALLCVVMRLAAMSAGTWVGARLSGAVPVVRRYGWLAFVSHAGLALSLTAKLHEQIPGELGDALFALVLAAIALNEMMGPVMLQLGLGLAGDLPGAAPGATTPSRPPEPSLDESRGWQPLGIPAFDDAVSDLALGMGERLASARELGVGAVESRARARIARLRADVAHVAVWIAARQEQLVDALPAASELAALARRWRDLCMEAAREPGGWDPTAVIAALDALVAELPEAIAAEIPAESLAPRAERLSRRVRRRIARARQRVRRSDREIRVRELGRFHVARAVGALGRAVAPLGRLDTHLADQMGAWMAALAPILAGAHEDPIGQLRAIDEEMSAAIKEVRRTVRAVDAAVAQAVGAVPRAIADDARALGTPDLAYRERRYSLVFGERSRGIAEIAAGLAATRATASAALTTRALALVVTAFEAFSRASVASWARPEGERMGALVRRADLAIGAIDAALEEMDAALDADRPPDALRAPISRLASETSAELGSIAGGLRDAAAPLADGTPVARLVDTLLVEAGNAGDSYTFGSGALRRGREVRVRDLLTANTETALAQHLLLWAHGVAAQLVAVADELEELDRIVAFNAERSAEVLAGAVDPAAAERARELVREALVRPVRLCTGRVRAALVRTTEGRSGDGAGAAIEGVLERIRAETAPGTLEGIRSFSGELGTRVRDRLRALAAVARHGAVSSAVALLAADPVDEGRRWLVGDDHDGPVRAPWSSIDLPEVYLRLFADRSLATRDMATGWGPTVAGLVECLRDRRKATRAAALTGTDEVGGAAVLAAVAHELRGAVVRHTFSGPVREAPVWVAPGWTGKTIEIMGLEWLFTLSRDGGGLLRDLRTAILADAGRNAFLVYADAPVWAAACRLSGLDGAFSDVRQLPRLDARALEEAIASRHGMSGFTADFEGVRGLGRITAVLGLTESELARRAWFLALHRTSRGVLHDSVRRWMAAIQGFDAARGAVRLGGVPRVPERVLAELPAEDAVVLLQVLRQGWISVGQFGELFASSPDRALSALSDLDRRGLLLWKGDRWVLPGHLRVPLHDALVERGWIPSAEPPPRQGAAVSAARGAVAVASVATVAWGIGSIAVRLGAPGWITAGVLLFAGRDLATDFVAGLVVWADGRVRRDRWIAVGGVEGRVVRASPTACWLDAPGGRRIAVPWRAFVAHTASVAQGVAQEVGVAMLDVGAPGSVLRDALTQALASSPWVSSGYAPEIARDPAVPGRWLVRARLEDARFQASFASSLELCSAGVGREAGHSDHATRTLTERTTD